MTLCSRDVWYNNALVSRPPLFAGLCLEFDYLYRARLKARTESTPCNHNSIPCTSVYSLKIIVMSFQSCLKKLRSRISNSKTEKHQARMTDEPILSLLTDPSEETRKKQQNQMKDGKRHLKRDLCLLLPYPQETPCNLRPVITVTAPDGTTWFPHDNQKCVHARDDGEALHGVKAPAPTTMVFCWDETNKEMEKGLLEVLDRIARLEWDFKSAISRARPMLSGIADSTSDLNKAIDRVYSDVDETKQEYCNLFRRVNNGLSPHDIAQANQRTERWLQNTSKYMDTLNRVASSMVWCDQNSKISLPTLPALFERIVKNYPEY